MAYRSYASRRRRQKYSRAKIFFAVGVGAGFILLVLAFLFFFTDLFRPLSAYVPLKISPSATVASVNGRLYYINGTTLICQTLGGEEVWTHKSASGALSLAVADDLICVYDEDSATILDEQKNLLFSVPSSAFKIRDVVCGKNSIALLTEMPDELSLIHIFIPRNVRLGEAPSHGLPISQYDAKCVGAEAYRELAEEVSKREEA